MQPHESRALTRWGLQHKGGLQKGEDNLLFIGMVCIRLEMPISRQRWERKTTVDEGVKTPYF